MCFRPFSLVFYALTAVWFLWESKVTQWPFLHLALVPLLVWATWSDIERLIIPNRSVAAIGLLGLIAAFPHQAGSHFWGAAVVFGALFGLEQLRIQWGSATPLGGGDIKFFAAGILCLGPAKIPELFLCACLLGIGWILISRNARRVPFAPSIAYAIFALGFVEPIFL